jgi:hypothetical protein
MSIWQEWFNNLSLEKRDDLIQRLYSVRDKQEPIFYNDILKELIEQKEGQTIRTHALYDENTIHYVCQQLGANSEKTYCSPSNGGRWNGWKITFKN